MFPIPILPDECTIILGVLADVLPFVLKTMLDEADSITPSIACLGEP